MQESRERWQSGLVLNRRDFISRAGVIGGLLLGGGTLLQACGGEVGAPPTPTPTEGNGTSPVGTPELTSVPAIEGLTSLLFLPTYVAQAEDYYGEFGIDLELTNVASASAAVQALVAGDGLFSLVGPAPIVSANQEGADGRIIAPIAFGFPLWVVGKEEIPPNDASAWKGRSMAIGPPPGVANTVMTWFLLSEGWEKDGNLWTPPDGGEPLEFREVEIGQETPAVLADQADMGFAGEPAVSVAVRQGPYHVIFDMLEHMGPYLFATWNTMGSTIREEPELVQGFVSAIVKAHKFVKAFPDRAIEIAVEQFGGEEPDIIANVTENLIESDLWPEDAYIPQDVFDKTFNEVLPAAGFPLEYPVAYDDLVDMSFVERANEEVSL